MQSSQRFSLLLNAFKFAKAFYSAKNSKLFNYDRLRTIIIFKLILRMISFLQIFYYDFLHSHHRLHYFLCFHRVRITHQFY